LQRRLIGDAVSVANQLICTTHAPRLAAYFEASQIQILMPDERSVRNLAGKLLIPESMINDRNPLIQLFTDHRISLIEALLFPAVLIPEGRIDYEWLRHLLDIAETGIQPIARVRSPIPPFGATVGVVPTRDSHVQLTCERLMLLHANVVVLVDGDRAGDQYATELLECAQPPAAIIQWPKNWAIEDVVVWAIGAEQGQLLLRINERIERNFQTLEELLCALKDSKAQNGGLKSHYIAHEEIACVMKRSREVVARVEIVLESISRAVLNRLDESSSHMTLDGDRSREQVRFYRFSE
jgi:putative ATP-dependent endonuclease of OLD family